jgi:subtilase family serine protease
MGVTVLAASGDQGATDGSPKRYEANSTETFHDITSTRSEASG